MNLINYKTKEFIVWKASVMLAYNANIYKTYGVFNKQLRELNDCAIKNIFIEKKNDNEYIFNITIDKYFFEKTDSNDLNKILENFLQEYLNLNTLKLKSFKTNFVKEIKGLDNFKMVLEEDKLDDLSLQINVKSMKNKM